jgi:hypothetical protein
MAAVDRTDYAPHPWSLHPSGGRWDDLVTFGALAVIDVIALLGWTKVSRFALRTHLLPVRQNGQCLVRSICGLIVWGGSRISRRYPR